MTYLASLDIFHVWLAMFSVSVSERLGTKTATEIRRDIISTVPLRTLHLHQIRKKYIKRIKRMTFDVECKTKSKKNEINFTTTQGFCTSIEYTNVCFGHDPLLQSAALYQPNHQHKMPAVQISHYLLPTVRLAGDLQSGRSMSDQITH